MDKERSHKRNASVYSRKVRAGKRRTYFIDVRRTKGDDYYLTLTESTKRFNREGYERHKIFLYKEDFNRFLDSLQDVVEHVKTELMPDYDYDEFTRKHEEYQNRQAAWKAGSESQTFSSNGQQVPADRESPAEEKAAAKSEEQQADSPGADDQRKTGSPPAETNQGASEEEDISW